MPATHDNLRHSQPHRLKQPPAFKGPWPTQCPALRVVVRGPAAMPSSKMGAAQAQLMAQIAGQHCGSGDVELEDAEDPCAYLARVYQPDPLALYPKLKDVRDRLGHLDPS